MSRTPSKTPWRSTWSRKGLPKSAQFLTKCVSPLPAPILTPRNDSGSLWGETCGPFWEFMVSPLAPKGLPKGHLKAPKITPKSVLQPEGPHGVPQRAQKSKMNPKKVQNVEKIAFRWAPTHTLENTFPIRKNGTVAVCAAALLDSK